MEGSIPPCTTLEKYTCKTKSTVLFNRSKLYQLYEPGNMSMEGTHLLPTLYNAMQCSVRRAPGNMSGGDTPNNAMQCSVRRAPGNMSMEGTHPLPTLYNAMQCSVRRAPGNMSMEGTHPLPTLYNAMQCRVMVTWRGHTPVQCHAVQCQEGTR